MQIDTHKYNLLTPQAMIDPYPVYTQLREESPVHWFDMFHSWFISRYDDVKTLLHDKRTQSSNAVNKIDDLLTDDMKQQIGTIRDFLGLWMIFMDPPDHTRLRRLTNPAFLPKIINHLRPNMTQMVDTLIDDLMDKGTMDFIADIAYPLPILVIADILGIPDIDRPLMKEWSQKMSTFFADQTLGPSDQIGVMHQTIQEMQDYMRTIISEQRKNPKDNVLGVMIQAEAKGDKLTEDELISTSIFFLFAGHDTTRNLIGNGLFSLLSNPEQYQHLQNDLTLIPSAVEEMLRYESAASMLLRDVTVDFELHGNTIQAGQKLFLIIGAANRDPRIFTNPDQFDITRNPNRHLAFGRGIHACIGMPLARAEIQILFEQVISRIHNMQLLSETPDWQPSFLQRGLTTLPVSFDNISQS